MYNPFRYRGYYYDRETSGYYLQSRYYNPEWGRFLNADAYLNANGDIIGLNLFAYGSNNPIMFVDPNGEAAWWQWLAGAAIVATCITITALTGGAGAAVVLGITTAIGAADGAICAAISGGDPLDGALSGAVGGAIEEW